VRRSGHGHRTAAGHDTATAALLLLLLLLVSMLG